jgi:hypothetical protein
MRKLICLATACLIATIPAAFAAGEIYRWKDSNGVWHYADQPQPGAELVSGSRKPPTPATPPPAPTVLPSATNPAAPPLPVSNEVAQQVRSEAATAKAEQCKKAEDSYNRSVQARRMFRTDEQGNRTFLSEAELDAARLQARAARDLACGP